jgi:hypothetical protein
MALFRRITTLRPALWAAALSWLLGQPAWAAYQATSNVSEQASTPTASTTLQNAATANGNGTSLLTSGYAWTLLTVNCASCSGGTTVNFEGTQDGTNYTSLDAVQAGGSTVAGSTTASGVTVWNVPVTGFQNIRARISGYSAGTVTVTATALPQSGAARVVKLDASNLNTTFGGAFPSAGSAIGVKNGTSLVALAGDSNGNADTDIHGNAGATLDSAAGTANSQALTIQGNASGIAVPVSQSGTWNIGSITTLPALAAGANTIGAVTQASGPWTVNLTQLNGGAPAALADNLANPTTLSLGSYLLGWDGTNSVWRRLQVDAASGTLKVDGSGATQPVSGTVTANQGGSNWSQNLAQVNGAAAAALADATANPTGFAFGSYLFGFNGTTWDRLRDDTNEYLYVDLGTALPTGANTIGAVKLTDGTNTAAVKAASTAAAAGDPSVVVALSPNSPVPTGANSIGTVGLNAGSNIAGKFGIDQTTPGTTNAVQVIPGTSGGWTPITEAALKTTVQTIKSSAGKLGVIDCYNPNTSSAVVEFFNTTGTVTLGTTAVAWFKEIPASAGANYESALGINFTSGIKTAAVTTVGGSTAPTTGVDCSIGFN